ncbi:MAG: VCBS repeat-containing protein [Ignavibacteria bacterium]|nr:VCBS repeat-containing protein [Ignavibacteria bacterium]
MLWFVGIQGCKLRNFFIIFSCYIILLNSSLFAQIPINGFCQLTEYPLQEEFTSILPVSFNGDGYTDIFLYNTENGKTLTLEAKDKLDFTLRSRSQFPVRISNIAYANKLSTNELFFTSRTARNFGTIRIGNTGALSYKVLGKTTSYPGQLISAELEHDNYPEIIMSGSAYNGIGIVQRSSGAQKLHDIYPKASFPLLVSGDFNNDGYTDLCGYENNSSTIQLFINNSRGNLRFIRSFQVGSPVTNLKSFDFNLDSYTDIAYSCGNILTFILGDPVNSFVNRKVIKLYHEPLKLIYGDFNQDGKIDIAYLNKEQNAVSVLFQKDSLNFYPEITLYTGSNLRDIVPFYSRFTNGFAVLSTKNILFFHQVLSFAHDVKLVPCGENCVPFTFDYNHDGLNDIGVFDHKNFSLNLFLRGKNGIPSQLIRIPAMTDGNAIIVDEPGGVHKVFYLLNTNSFGIEIIDCDLEKYSYRRDFLNIQGAIKTYKTSETTGNSKIQLAVWGPNQLNILSIEGTKIQHIYPVIQHIKSDSLLDAQFTSDGNLTYVMRKSDTVAWCIYDTARHYSREIYKFIDTKSALYKTYCSDLLNEGKEQMLMLTEDSKTVNSYFSFLNGRSLPVKFMNNIPGSVLHSKNYYLGKFGIADLNRLFIHSNDDILKLDILRSKKRIIANKLFSAPGISSFIVKNLSGRYYSILCSLKNKSYLWIGRI